MFAHNALLFARTIAVAPETVPLTYRDWISRPEVQYPFFISIGLLVLILLVRLPDLLAALRARHKEVLGPVDLDAIMNTTKMTIVDLRLPEDFNGPKGHLKGSFNFPIQMLTRRLPEVAEDKRQLVVLVDGSDAVSHQAAALLQAEGYLWVRVLKGGMRAWRARALPVSVSGSRR